MKSWGLGALGAVSFLTSCTVVHHSARNAPDPIEPGDSAFENTASLGPVQPDATHPFFRDNGANGRVCGTCHHEDQGWTTTPAFARTLPDDDPLFLFDGSDCLPTGVTNPSPKQNSTEMLGFGNVRVELPIVVGADYSLSDFVDPHACAVAPTVGALRMYRRPLPVANTHFLSVVMWDGRESVTLSVSDDLAHQSDTANRVHAQATAALSDDDRRTIVDFETGLFHARRRIADLDLAASGGHGGPGFLLEKVAPGFFTGKNSPFAGGFDAHVFTLYAAWEPGPRSTAPTALAASIGRGEVIFNSKAITIDGVGGINGPNDPSQAPLRGSCSTCHSDPNVGNVSVSDFLDIGATRAGAAGLDVAHLPTYRFRENGTGRTVAVTDPGRGRVSGRFADLGKTKIPNLRGLSVRAPYFHNGSAKDLATVVAFYEQRFGIGFTAQEREDLVAFLGAL
jgi:cytochrome c peroxidase